MQKLFDCFFVFFPLNFDVALIEHSSQNVFFLSHWQRYDFSPFYCCFHLKPLLITMSAKFLKCNNTKDNYYSWNQIRRTHQPMSLSKSLKSLTSELPRSGAGISLLMFSFMCETQVKERWSAWLTTRRTKKGEGAGSITWTQLLHLTTTIHHLHPPSATIPSPHLGWLSRQIGQTLCHPKEAPPCTNWKPERHS